MDFYDLMIQLKKICLFGKTFLIKLLFFGRRFKSVKFQEAGHDWRQLDNARGVLDHQF